MMNEPDDLELQECQLQARISRREHAVYVRKACKRYGHKWNPVIVLNGLNMTVPKGAIYGLLGASGCGKTTLLNCIVGKAQLNSGDVWVLGGTPGCKGSGVPGPNIGYMPQETALYDEFSIRETFHFIGWLCGITTQKTRDQLEFLTKLFILPDSDSLVRNLSGGQQRRVSLAAALLHEPELLILDEPTVGLDPLLRQNIWSYFAELTKHGKTTIIITTHYIEEARQAHLIGMMRQGYLLAEDSPETLMAKFGCESLEHVFLKLSIFQNLGKINITNVKEVDGPLGSVNEAMVLDDEVQELPGRFCDNIAVSSTRNGSIEPKVIESVASELPPNQEISEKYLDFFVVNLDHLWALMWKNYLWFRRNIATLLFLLALPISQTVLSCLTLGRDPKGLHVSVVNYELGQAEACRTMLQCNGTRLSCNYLENLQKRTLQLDFYPTEKEAKDSVRNGDTWATLIFASNFSGALKNRIKQGIKVRNWDLTSSSVKVYQDKSNEYIATLIQRQLYFALEDFIKEYLTSCDIDSKIGTIPIRWQKPIYGENLPDFADFVAPGAMLSVIFFVAVASLSGSMLVEREEGMLARCKINGVTNTDILFSQLLTHGGIMALQAVLVIGTILIFKFTFNGSVFLALLLMLTTGLLGMSYGLTISCFFDGYVAVTYAAMGSMLPVMFLCGVAWPVEGISKLLRPISYVFPFTKSMDSLRSIMIRGWGINMSMVYEGFIITFIWIIILLVLSVLCLRFKKN